MQSQNKLVEFIPSPQEARQKITPKYYLKDSIVLMLAKTLSRNLRKIKALVMSKANQLKNLKILNLWKSILMIVLNL